MRENALALLKSVDDEGITYIFHHSKPRAVMIPVDAFVQLQERLEDLQDERDAQKLAKQPREKGISLQKIMKNYV